MNYTSTMYHYDKAMHDTQMTKTKSRHLCLLCLFVIEQMYHDYHFYSVIAHSIQYCTLILEFLKALANYNTMKMHWSLS